MVLSDGAADLELRFKEPAAGKDPALVGTTWTLKGIEVTEGEAVSFTPPVAGTTITLAIGADGRVSGSAGVNRYFGQAEAGKDDKITFGPMGSTRMGGPPEAMKQEQNFLKKLQAVTSWAMEDQHLRLTDAEESFVLIFEVK